MFHQEASVETIKLKKNIVYNRDVHKITHTITFFNLATIQYIETVAICAKIAHSIVSFKNIICIIYNLLLFAIFLKKI